MKKMRRAAAWILSVAMVLGMLPSQGIAAPKAVEAPAAAVEQSVAADPNVIVLGDDVAFELEANTVMAKALLDSVDVTVDETDPEMIAVRKELESMKVTSKTVNADGSVATAQAALSDDEIDMIMGIYQLYLYQRMLNADVMGVQTPYYLQYNDNDDKLGILGEMLILAGFTVEDVRAGKQTADDLVGLVLNFYYGDYFGVSNQPDLFMEAQIPDEMKGEGYQPQITGGFMRKALEKSRDTAMDMVKELGPNATEAQKYFVLNEFVSAIDVMDMAFIMNKGTDANMNAEQPALYKSENAALQQMTGNPYSSVEMVMGVTQEQFATVYNTLYGFYAPSIKAQFAEMFLPMIKQDARKGVYDDTYWALIDQFYGEAVADMYATKQADDFMAFAEQIGGIPNMDEQGNPVFNADGTPSVMFTWNDLVEQAMDTPLDMAPFNAIIPGQSLSPNQAIVLFADEAASGLAAGVFSYWEGSHIGAMTQKKSVCLGYTGALAFLTQCMHAEYYTTDGNYKNPQSWKNAQEVYFNADGSLAIDKYYADHIRIVFDAEVTMFGDVQPKFSSEHFWNAVRIDNNWYYIDCCYSDVFAEVMVRDQVPADGSMNHMYFLISDATMRDMMEGNFSELDTFYTEMSKDTRYESSWFNRSISDSSFDKADGNFYYTYDSTDMINMYFTMKDANAESNNNGGFNQDMSANKKLVKLMKDPTYGIVKHSINAADLIKQTNDDGDEVYGADSNFDFLIEFNRKIDQNDESKTAAYVYNPSTRRFTQNQMLTDAFAAYKKMEENFPSAAISCDKAGDLIFFNLADAIFTYNIKNGDVKCVYQYPTTVYATKDKSVKLGGEAFRVAKSGEYSTTYAPTAGLLIDEDGSISVSVSANYSYISGKDTMIAKDYGYEFKESDFQRGYNSYSSDLFDNQNTGFGQQQNQEERVKNDNDEFMFSAIFKDTLKVSDLQNANINYKAPECNHKYILYRQKYYTKDDYQNYGTGAAWVCVSCGDHIKAHYASAAELEENRSQMDQYSSFMDGMDLSGYVEDYNDQLEAIAGKTIYTIADGDWEGNVFYFSKLKGDANAIPEGYDYSREKDAVVDITLDEPVACAAAPVVVSGNCESGLTIKYAAQGYTSEGFYFSVDQPGTEQVTLPAGQHVFSDTEGEEHLDAWTWENGKATLNVDNLTCIACGKTVADCLTTVDSGKDATGEAYTHVVISNPKAADVNVVKGTKTIGTVSCTQHATTFSVADGKITATKATTVYGHEHELAEEVTQEPTCQVAGVKTITCTVAGCDYSTTEAIPTVDHSFDENGVCKWCGTTTEGHQHVAAGEGTELAAQTCVQDGVTEFECATCKQKYTVTAPATGHTPGEPEVTKDPTCTAEGTKTTKCTVCTEIVKTETIPANGHTEKTVVTKATCTEDGSTVVVCEVCETELSREVIKATGHDFGEDKNAEKCAVCGEENPDYVAPEPEDPKTEDPKTEDPKTEDPKTEDPKTEEPEDPKTEDPKTDDENELTPARTSVKGETTTEEFTLGLVVPSVDITLAAVKGHKWSYEFDWTQSRSSTIATLTCDNCGEVEKRVLYPEKTTETAPTCVADATESYTVTLPLPSGKWDTQGMKNVVNNHTYTNAGTATGHTLYTTFTWDDVKTDVKNGEQYQPTATLHVLCATCGQDVQDPVTVPGFPYAEDASSTFECHDGVRVYAATYNDPTAPDFKHPELSMTVAVKAIKDHEHQTWHRVATDVTGASLEGGFDDILTCDVCSQETQRVPVGTTVTYADGENETTEFLRAGTQEAYALQPLMYEKTGFHQDAWVAEDGTEYKDQADVTAMVADPDTYETAKQKNLKLNTNWKNNEFKVVFKAGTKGTGSMDAITVTYNKSKKLTANKFKRTGYHFTGWRAYRTKDKTYYGNKIVVDENGESKTVTGWFPKAELDSYKLFANKAQVKKITTGHGDTINMTAQWAANTFTISFKANLDKASGKMDKLTVTYGKSKKLTANKFSKKGYSFVNWRVYSSKSKKWLAKDKDGNKVWATAKTITNKKYTYFTLKNKAQVKNLTTTNEDTIELNAQWKKK